MSYELGLGIGLSMIGFIFAYLSINMGNENKYIRMFFLILSMWGITITLSVLEEIANINAITAIENMLEAMTVVMISISTLFTFLIVLFGFISAVNLYRGKSVDSGIEDYDEEDTEKKRIFS